VEGRASANEVATKYITALEYIGFRTMA